jgi:hypothetical protein
MKVITTGLLNRFWTKGIKPWLDKRIKSYADLMVTTASGYTPDALAVKEGFTELNGKLNQDADLTLVNCVSWSSDNSISKIGNRVFVTIGVQITSEQSSGSLIITNIAKTYYPKNAYVRANATGGTSGNNHNIYINKSNGTIILNPSTERYYSASFSYLSD